MCDTRLQDKIQDKRDVQDVRYKEATIYKYKEAHGRAVKRPRAC